MITNTDPMGNGRILVVDDDGLNRLLLSTSLEEEGYTVETAEDGRQALEMLHTRPFDVVLLDLLMPEMDGFQVLEQMKAGGSWQHIPVIVVSAANEMESVVRCIEMGATEHLPKPFDPVLLHARINASLTAKRLHDQEVLYLRQIQKEKKRVDDLLNVVIPIGMALSAERDLNSLLEKTLLEAMSFCNADAGTLYLRTEDDLLEFVIVRNNSLNIAMGGTSGQEISFSPLHLYDKITVQPNHRNIVTYATLSDSSVNIPDAYQSEDFDFSGTKAFDAEIGYRSTSFLTIPLKNSVDYVIGVLQLINAQATETSQVIPFDENLQQMVESMSLLAAVALESYIREQALKQEIQQLHIEIDQVKKERQIAEITRTEYFRQLQSKADGLRQRRKRGRKG